MLKAGLTCMIALVAVIATGCGGAPADDGDRPPTVVATTTIVADLVRSVASDRVRVVPLMGPGVDPHLYKASAGDVRRMADADAIVSNGLHLEGKLAELLEQMGERGRKSLAVATCVPEDRLIATEGFSGLHDPHVWFDVTLWKQTIPCVAELLGEVDPEGVEVYRQAAGAYAAVLDDLDAWVRERIATVPQDRRVLVTAHDAFGYFGRAYGLQVRGLMGISTASEAGTGDVQQLAEFIVERGIPAVFVETSVPPRYVEALREAVIARGAEVTIGGHLYSDALGDASGDAATYVGTVRHNVTTIVTALGGTTEGAS
jgi:manganese/zinc/iron transport system substrate-binding protein